MFPAYLFVDVLSCSGYIYAELCQNMKSENFIGCHVHAYEYFGGVPLLVPDNLRVDVTKNPQYETVIPRFYHEMAEHYGAAIVSARPKAPDDKPNAEGAVKYATTWILAVLRNHHFFSFKEVRAAVAEKLEELNTRLFQKHAAAAILPMKRRNGNSCTRFHPRHMNWLYNLQQKSRMTIQFPMGLTVVLCRLA